MTKPITAHDPATRLKIAKLEIAILNDVHRDAEEARRAWAAPRGPTQSTDADWQAHLEGLREKHKDKSPPIDPPPALLTMQHLSMPRPNLVAQHDQLAADYAKRAKTHRWNAACLHCAEHRSGWALPSERTPGCGVCGGSFTHPSTQAHKAAAKVFEKAARWASVQARRAERGEALTPWVDWPARVQAAFDDRYSRDNTTCWGERPAFAGDGDFEEWYAVEEQNERPTPPLWSPRSGGTGWGLTRPGASLG